MRLSGGGFVDEFERTLGCIAGGRDHGRGIRSDVGELDFHRSSGTLVAGYECGT